MPPRGEEVDVVTDLDRKVQGHSIDREEVARGLCEAPLVGDDLAKSCAQVSAQLALPRAMKALSDGAANTASSRTGAKSSTDEPTEAPTRLRPLGSEKTPKARSQGRSRPDR